MTIQLYTWGTPNGRKVSIALEELGLPYRSIAIDITKDQQFDPAFLKISPNNKIPAIVDPDGPAGSRSRCSNPARSCSISPTRPAAAAAADGGALPGAAVADVADGRLRPDARPGPPLPALRQGKVPYAERPLCQRDQAALRRPGPAPGRGRDFLGGDDYSIADIATYPWAARHEWQGIELAEFPNVKRWYDGLTARPAVAKGMQVP